MPSSRRGEALLVDNKHRKPFVGRGHLTTPEPVVIAY